MKYELPKLPYSYDALEPYIDARTMETHHAKHHRAYVDKLNEALDKHPELKAKTLEELLGRPDSIPEDIRGAVRNHGGGHFNHSLFWKIMVPPGKEGGGEPSGVLSKAIAEKFGSFADFQKNFSVAAMGVFGSGWAWLVVGREASDKRRETSNSKKEFKIIATPNQDSPISQGLQPIFGLDVWEHAYYLKYQNRRPEYIAAWWNVVNWREIEKNFEVSQ
ncbi:MAG: superoxide dismutase [Candidatus Ryanbacteria bacterium RIFCSPLOWO2_01_FULL_48_26]|uniref:Superoxide dismutase n=1 Tax=Candidatus Ryanbacteria bacterium RIFCSPLOWO2_01_FULL_48_26 TaxID=1802126 RepID=A0A1G2GQZ0_9BACT|nr:MAG: superoxide dismutase [Candidatus Ryanbacteria bacterium RIFCSPLOWO2_01_FULL_48_26]OHB22074.1 MAG: superoxide dismutase [Parcubacteria group bacterium RIFCSPHIGHO2_02_FULL_48_10b]